MSIKAIRDEHGTLYRVSAYVPTAHKGPMTLQTGPASPEIDVWWNRDRTTKSGEVLVLRQDNGHRADVITMTQGQAYDLLRAIALAVVHP